MIEILSTGSGMSFQDGGRAGWRRFGLPSGGAMDRRSLAAANTLLGNLADAPVLEIVHLGARIRVLEDTWLALAGADFCGDLESGTAMSVPAGDVLAFDRKAVGLYAYLAAPGGFQVRKWLGSGSTDLRNGLGVPLVKGSRLRALRPTPNILIESVGRRLLSEPPTHIVGSETKFELYRGPQFDAFDAETAQSFVSAQWTVSRRSDRAGYRLEGPPLSVPQSIASEPVLPGSFQVPGNGLPIVTMVDGPTVGGYAKIAVLKASDLDRMAQCAPGTQLKFAWVD